MVLIINLDCKPEILNDLYEYLIGKDYGVKIIDGVLFEPVQYLLDYLDLFPEEIELLQGFEKCYSYNHSKLQDYDILIYTNLRKNLQENYGGGLNEKWFKQINKFLPKFHLDIRVVKNKQTKTDTKILRHITESENNIEEIKKLLYQELPTCKWCGRIFTKTKHNKKYCSEKCRKYAFTDQCRINNQKYYKRYKNVLGDKEKGALGSKGANLHGKADTNPLSELQKIRNAKRSLGI